MPDVREVFDLVTREVRPAPGALTGSIEANAAA
jgi:hypothetical protein